MSRMSYKTALRAKGIRPIPPAERLRSSLNPVDEKDMFINATEAALAERCITG